MSLTVTLSRTELSLAPLVIGVDPAAGLWLSEDGQEHPTFTMRRTSAPTSAYLAGGQLLSAVTEMGTLPLTIYAGGASVAAMYANRAVLDAAATQFAFTVTVTVDGHTETYAADPEFPAWGPLDSGMVAACMSRGTLTLPVHPPGS